MYNIDTLKIRLLEPADREKVIGFFSKLGEEGTGFFNRGHGNENRTLDFCDGKLGDHVFWAAVNETEEGEEIVGIVFLWDRFSCIPWLGIGITEEWKGKHLGRRLITTAREYCESIGCGGILLTTAQNNLRGQGLYERCGFEKLGVHSSGEFQYLLRFPNQQAQN